MINIHPSILARKTDTTPRRSDEYSRGSLDKLAAQVTGLRGERLRVGLLGTYPPEQCGLATFGAALGEGLTRAGHTTEIIRAVQGRVPFRRGEHGVSTLMVHGDKYSLRRSAVLLSECDVAIIQHEYGIYGGEDGDEILELLAMTTVPTIVVLHTVLTEPSRHQRTVLISLALLADHIVVMTQTAYDRLATIYPIDMKKVTLIPHGATPPVGAETRNDIPPQLLTWGLLGPGKGIEHVIDALALLKDMDPQPRYTISGVTHPKVLAHSGDIYRESLIRRAHEQGVDHLVTFDDTYRTVHELTAFVASSTVVILPYDSRDQITSGVLVDAIVAGCPVIATTFPHATELLSDGAGILVPHGNPPAIAAAIRTLLTDAHALHVMRKEVAQIAVTHTWEDVSYRYSLLAMSLLATTPSTHAAPSRTAKDTAYSYAAVKKGQRP